MTRFFISLLFLTATALAAQVAPPRPLVGPAPEVHDAAALAAVTFNKDVLPILQKNCQVCHRPGEAAPMSFLTYETTRPWAKAIKQAVVNKKMPPWFAEPGYVDYRNDPSLTGHEIAVLSAWVDNGAPEGNPEEKPKTVAWKSGWRIEPDVVISIPAPYKVAAKGSGEIKSFLVPNPFREDTWVSSIEVRPGNPSVVHHVMVQVPEDTPAPSFSWGAAAAPCFVSPVGAQQDFNESLPIPLPSNLPVPGLLNRGPQPNAPKPPRNFAILEAVYAPGTPPMDFSLYDSAKLIPGGGNLRIEVHYTPNGKETTDQTSVGFKLAKEPPQHRYVTLAPRSLANANKRIPPGAANWETRGELEFGRDAQLVWLMPHMHLRGKDMSFSLASNGKTETVLDAKFNFNWQLGYEMDRPIRVRKGTRMVVVAHHDNSANNPYNPDPSREVGWGDLTTDEMVLPWFGVIVDRDADPENILAIRQNGCSGARGIFPGFAVPQGIPSLPVIQGVPGLPALPIPIPIPLPSIGR
jgi:hypothetical protein